MMLTGDHMLTSIATFKELKINQKPFAYLENYENKLKCKDENDFEISSEKWGEYNLAINGSSL